MITVNFPEEKSKFVAIQDIPVGSAFVVDGVSKGLYYKGWHCIVRLDCHDEWFDTSNFMVNHLSWTCRQVDIEVTVR